MISASTCHRVNAAPGLGPDQLRHTAGVAVRAVEDGNSALACCRKSHLAVKGKFQQMAHLVRSNAEASDAEQALGGLQHAWGQLGFAADADGMDGGNNGQQLFLRIGACDLGDIEPLPSHKKPCYVISTYHFLGKLQHHSCSHVQAEEHLSCLAESGTALHPPQRVPKSTLLDRHQDNFRTCSVVAAG